MSCRVDLPKATKPQQEAELSVRKEKYLNCFKKYRNQFCNSKGQQRSNLSKDQRLGLKSLQERVKKQEIVICKSDKSGKLVAVGPGEYLELDAQHIKDDRRLAQGEVEDLKVINQHTASWIKITKLGESWRQTKRFKETMLNDTANVLH